MVHLMQVDLQKRVLLYPKCSVLQAAGKNRLALSASEKKFFVILQFVDNVLHDLPEKLSQLFLISNSSHSQLFTLLSLISQLIRLIKFHPLGLELYTRVIKSSVTILHLPFSSVQFRLRFR